ncbi:MAG: Na+/H+ antiporter subunit E [Melioribacteraceae bacterium]|nr:Na+/H+ antiporter subunit E [Melioribacteraceae bacterium]
MNYFLYNILLALTWMFLTGDLDFNNFLEGFLIGFAIVLILKASSGETKYFSRIPKLISFIIYFTYELILANLKIAMDILTPTHLMKPAIVAIPLDAKTDLEITLFANIITLTPGTLSLDLSKDRKTLYIHAMYVVSAEETIKEIKEGFEKKLLEVMR